MPTASWNGKVIAESDETIMVEGNHYFPPESVADGVLQPAEKTTVCHWKGEARYFDIVIDGMVNSAAAWTYPDPKPKAADIRDHVAFWGGVTVS